MSKPARITDETKLSVIRGAENPFEKGTSRWKKAQAVLTSHGKLFEDAKKKGGDSWAVRQLVELKLVKVAAAPAK
jgi:hypothetical protein